MRRAQDLFAFDLVENWLLCLQRTSQGPRDQQVHSQLTYSQVPMLEGKVCEEKNVDGRKGRR